MSGSNSGCLGRCWRQGGGWQRHGCCGYLGHHRCPDVRGRARTRKDLDNCLWLRITTIQAQSEHQGERDPIPQSCSLHSTSLRVSTAAVGVHLRPAGRITDLGASDRCTGNMCSSCTAMFGSIGGRSRNTSLRGWTWNTRGSAAIGSAWPASGHSRCRLSRWMAVPS